MRVLRIAQVVLLALLIGYGVVFHNANPQPLALPGLLPLPASLVILLAVLIAFLSGRVPPSIRGWRQRRELARLKRRITDLEQHVPSYDRDVSAPVIPDRAAAPEPEEPRDTERSRR
ncbi:MAG: LapA family protein [Trueperaceae bacterium]|nr:LapA family protein [Trueperaceae bacterium]